MHNDGEELFRAYKKFYAECPSEFHGSASKSASGSESSFGVKRLKEEASANSPKAGSSNPGTPGTENSNKIKPLLVFFKPYPF